ncbi:hypothetical protein RFI_30280 [Reticulomyxa filosa]|uniref:Transmembrane protein n=1 Tax=Reticulomyxa filosa TaxID=46433 RepID=X6M0G5_RETFI|nr:hypothetical protein RFI_30280 [Reticulomyxa filosa]|eukprot:ETO07111.1 hypothetical protein RFI_30280 [Reticulomyxa filosa]
MIQTNLYYFGNNINNFCYFLTKFFYVEKIFTINKYLFLIFLIKKNIINFFFGWIRSVLVEKNKHLVPKGTNTLKKNKKQKEKIIKIYQTNAQSITTRKKKISSLINFKMSKKTNQI